MSTNTPDYKSTIQLPQTDFPMKGNLPTKEPEIIKEWDNKEIYKKMLAKNRGKKSFVMPDGPPYANGSIHIGHALNKNLKDIVVKYKNMAGFCSPFIPGWDCHGLPIEHKVIKDLGSKAAEKTDAEIRKLCREEAQKWVDIQAGQFRRLGVMADWANPYLTMDKMYEAEEVREFARAYKRGVIYRGEKPVYWNWTIKTALADAEVEYHMHKSPSIYVKFDVKDAETLKRLGNPSKPTAFVIWTTTPWTLPANLGISVHPDFDYSLYDTGSENLIIAKGLKESFEKETGLKLTEGKMFKGKDFDLMKAQHPFMNRTSLLMNGLHVSLDAGTGAVHTAPGHGADDYKVGLQYGLRILSPVDESGKYTDEVPDYVGVNIFKANPMIVDRLKQSGHLLGYKELEHSYPHCWRTKTPLIFRATPQWFLGLDQEESQIRRKTLKAIDEIKFFPAWGEARLRSMMENRPDWCLSRQRIWGVPIPIFYCIETGEPFADYDTMMKAADLMEKENGIDSYFGVSPDQLIGGNNPRVAEMKKKNPKFGSKGFRHGKDILDVWFDSGICHAAVQKRRPDMSFPADIYLEGSDQHRGWFNTSLLSSMAINEKPPFKALITHGFVNDSEGKKMSKSKGNSVDPNEVSAKSGSEIVRLWTVYEDYGQDLTCGQEELTRVTETYRRIRNTMRFLLGANFDFETSQAVPYEKMSPIDQWALHELTVLIEKVTAAYDNYEFYKVYHALNQFFTVDLSATYLDILKDRLYTWKVNGVQRKSSQTVIDMITRSLAAMMAPVLSFLAEETYSYLRGAKKDSVFLEDFPVANSKWKNETLAADIEELLKVRADVQKNLETLRNQKTIGASLEASVEITADNNVYQKLEQYKDHLREFFIVSEVKIKKGNYAIQARRADGEKCVRCWSFDTETGKNSQFPGVCRKCVEALS